MADFIMPGTLSGTAAIGGEDYDSRVKEYHDKLVAESLWLNNSPLASFDLFSDVISMPFQLLADPEATPDLISSVTSITDRRDTLTDAYRALEVERTAFPVGVGEAVKNSIIETWLNVDDALESGKYSSKEEVVGAFKEGILGTDYIDFDSIAAWNETPALPDSVKQAIGAVLASDEFTVTREVGWDGYVTAQEEEQHREEMMIYFSGDVKLSSIHAPAGSLPPSPETEQFTVAASDDYKKQLLISLLNSKKDVDWEAIAADPLSAGDYDIGKYAGEIQDDGSILLQAEWEVEHYVPPPREETPEWLSYVAPVMTVVGMAAMGGSTEYGHFLSSIAGSGLSDEMWTTGYGAVLGSELDAMTSDLASEYTIIGDVKEGVKTVQDIQAAVDDPTTLFTNEIVNISYIGDALNVDSEITDTIVSLNDLHTDLQAFEAGDYQKRLEIAGKYLDITPSTFTPDFIKEGGVDLLVDMDTWANDLGLEGFDIDLSGIETDFSFLFEGDSIDMETYQAYSDLGIDLGQYGIELPIGDLSVPEIDIAAISPYDYSFEYEEGLVSEEFVGQEEPTDQIAEQPTEEEEPMEGEIGGEIALQQRQRQRGRPTELDEEGLKRTDIFQAQTEGTTELGLQAPTVEPLTLDLPTFVNPYDPRYKYDPLRSA